VRARKSLTLGSFFGVQPAPIFFQEDLHADVSVKGRLAARSAAEAAPRHPHQEHTFVETETAAKVPGIIVRPNAHDGIVVDLPNQFELFCELATGSETENAFIVSVDREKITYFDA
jgi:hypothetical protein